MRFVQTVIAAALVAFAAAQDAGAAPTGTLSPPTPAQASQCAAAMSACPSPDGSCIGNVCSSCQGIVPCCAAPSASQLSCIQAQASAASSIAKITDPAQLTSSVACVVAQEIGGVCAAASTGFPQLPAESRASCLCYQNRGQSSSVWAPAFFDAAISNCAGFLGSSGPPSAAAAFSSDIGLCSKAGNIRSLPAVSANPTGGVSAPSAAPAAPLPPSSQNRIVLGGSNVFLNSTVSGPAGNGTSSPPSGTSETDFIQSSPAETGASGTAAGSGSTDAPSETGAPSSSSSPVPTRNAGSSAFSVSQSTIAFAGSIFAILGFVFSL